MHSATASYGLKNLYTIDPTFDSHKLSPNVSWYIDSTASQGLQDIIKANLNDQFTQNQKANINLGSQQGNVWFYLPLRLSGSSFEAERVPPWYVSLDSMMLTPIDLYVRRSNGSIEQHSLGDLNYHREAPIYSPNLAKDLQLMPGESVELYFKVNSKRPIRFTAELLSLKSLHQKNFKETIFYSAIFGIIIMMIFYSLFAFSAIGGRNHIYFILFISSVSVLHASLTGHTNFYLWPTADRWQLLNAPLLTHLTCILALQFTRFFLRSFDHSPFNDLVLKALIVMSFSSFMASLFLNYTLGIYLAIGMAFFASVTITYSAYRSLKRGYLTARFFLVGWSCLLLGQVIYSSMKFDLLPINFFNMNAYAIGAAIATIFLALSLEDQINNRMRRKVHAEKNTREQLEVTNQELSIALTKLAQSNKVKDQFLATISHELRTPMNGVEGSLDLLNTKLLSDQQQTYVDSAQISAKEMTSMVDSILRFSEIQSGQVELSNDPFEIRQSLNPAAMRYKNLCQRKGLEFNWYIDKNVPMLIEGDCDNLALITKHLVDNAIKFTNKGKITVDLRLKNIAEGSAILQLAVNDTGEGIPKEKLNKVCEAFYQLDNSYNRRHNGLGIGLAICKQLTDLMGGDIDVKSTVGQGTQVKVTMPIKLVTETAAQSEEELDTRIPLENSPQKTILVAEDNPVNQLVMNGMLELLGCYIITADNGQEVIDILETQPVDLILMDCQMPIMDGYEATETIRTANRHYSNIPIIAVTANAMTGDSQRCLAAGMNDYIKKPISRDILFEKVSHWLKISIESAA